MLKKRVYYGWILVGVGFLCYGFGIAPAYAAWGFFAPELREELTISRAGIGGVFGLFAFAYHVTSPLAALLIARLGLRVTITGGSLMVAVGFWLLSRADSLFDCYLAFAIIVGTGVGLSTVIPMQAMATYWFKRYRARALAIIVSGGTSVAVILNPLNNYLLRHGGWRWGWKVYAGIAVVVAVVAAVFIRNTPEESGLLPDGVVESAAEQQTDPAAAANATRLAAKTGEREWTAREAIFNGRFFLITFCGMAYIGPWLGFSTHGRIHLEGFAFSSTLIAGLLSFKDSMSTVGRLLASAGDFISPQRLLAVALLVEAVGMAGLTFAKAAPLAYISGMLFGFGYGASVVCVPLTLARFFGRKVFVYTSGASRMLQGAFASIVPTIAGMIADSLGTYAIPFLGMSLLAMLGAVGILFCRPFPAREGKTVVA